MDLISPLKSRRPASVEVAFAEGDYVTAALKGTPSQWQYHAARGMIVDPLAGARALADFDSADACFYRAVCAWIGGDEELARLLLERLGDVHARNLLDLINRRRIEVLAQLPPMRDGPFVLLDGVASDRKFNVRNLGTARGDIPAGPYASVHEFYGHASQPNFFVCSMVEWHHIPIDIGELPCPTIGCTSDFDAHILTAAPWLGAFDIMLTCDQIVEWTAVKAITNAPVFAYPVLFGAPRNLPSLEPRERDIDVFMSGTMMSAYQPDKARLVHQLIRVPNVKLLLLDGHLGLKEYFELLSRAKVTPSFCRHPGAMLTRSIEALSMGSITLVQRDSPHLLWGGQDEGVFVYDEVVGPGPQIADILANYERYGPSCVRNAGFVRGAFKAENVASRFFRFCTVLAACPLSQRDPTRHAFLTQKRQIFIRGPRVDLDRGVELCEANLDRLAELAAAAPSAQLRNDMARELMLLYGQISYFHHETSGAREPFEQAVDILDGAARSYPDSLIVHANLMRALYRFGDAAQRERALGLAFAIVDRPASEWHIEPMDDIYPYDFGGSSINSRDYFDLIVLSLVTQTDVRDRMRDIILASIFHLLAIHLGRTGYARKAVLLDPEFPFYRLTLAELLLGEPASQELEEARRLLLELVQDSAVADRARAQLRALESRARLSGRVNLSSIEEVFSHGRRSLLLHEHHYERLTSQFALSGKFRRGGERGTVVHKRALPRGPVRLSAVLCGCAGLGCRQVINALSQQSVPREMYEIVYVECYDDPPGVLWAADTVLSCNQDSFFEYRLVALNAALEQTVGEVVVVIEPGWSPDPTLIYGLLTAFYGGEVARGAVPGGAAERRVVVGRMASAPEGFPSFTAFRPADSVALGNFDEHQAFAGDLGIAYELAWRLFRAGVPSFELGAQLESRQLAPWWKIPALAGYHDLLKAAAMISPGLLDEGRIAALLPRAVKRPVAIAPKPGAAALELTLVNQEPHAQIEFRQPLLGLKRHVYRAFMRVAMGADTTAKRLAEGDRLLGALIAGALVLCKPLLYRLLSKSLYFRLAKWYWRVAGKP